MAVTARKTNGYLTTWCRWPDEIKDQNGHQHCPSDHCQCPCHGINRAVRDARKP